MKQKTRNKLGACVIIVAGLAGLLSGCASIPAMHNDVQQYYEKTILPQINDKNNVLSYLGVNEYVIPKDIFEAYATTIDKRDMNGSTHAGGYFNQNYLDTVLEKEEFTKKLNDLGLEDKDVDNYSEIFSSEGAIIFSSLALEDGSLELKLRHERLHRDLKTISSEDYDYLMSVAQEMLVTYDDKGVRVVHEKGFSGSVYAYMACLGNKEEFYTYITQGVFTSATKDFFKENYPKAYEMIYDLYDKTAIAKLK